MTREICKLCGRESAVGFSVPDDIWNAITEGRWSRLCVACFAAVGDSLLIEWDQDIQFWPVSLATFRKS